MFLQVLQKQMCLWLAAVALVVLESAAAVALVSFLKL
jgi:hypothetical protein